MNAMLSLVMTACVASPAQAPAADHKDHKDAKAPAVAVAAPTPSSCGTGCGGCATICCDTSCDGPSLLDRLRARLRRDDCGCDSGCEREGLLSRLRNRFKSDDCGCNSGCEREGLLSRLRNRLRRGDDCCPADCCPAPGCATPITAPKKVEPIQAPKTGGEPPKELPKGDKDKQTRSIAPQPIMPPALEVTPTITPNRTPAPEAEPRNPF